MYLSEEAGFALAKQMRLLSDLCQVHLDMAWKKCECDGEGMVVALSDSIALLPSVESPIIKLCGM